ncbi:MAG: toll/interleukin-1 receptor domain-containing protein [Bryobacteraceae bacterium]|nr:toll/interleukin-1 receptor domain-containing protein [Bryobacteraceae bacterium]
MKGELRAGRLLRRYLESGQPVEIEGVGSMRLGDGDRILFRAPAEPRVFLGYVEEDLEPVRRLCDALRRGGFAPWLDKEQLLPGQNWPRAIERALDLSDFFLGCFSARSVVKRGQFQAELRWALDCASRMPLEETFIIPVRLENCEIPRPIRSRLQYVDLFPDFDRGVARVVKAIRKAMAGRCLKQLAEST